MKTKLTLTMMLMGFLIAGTAVANPVSAKDVVAGYVEALGGAKILSNFESRHITGLFGQSGMIGDLNIYATANQDYRMRLALTGVGEFEEGIYKGTGWTYDTMSGPQLMAGVHLESSLVRNHFNVEMGYFELYKDVVYEAEEEFDGVICHKLRLVGSWGNMYEYFDLETGLLRGSEGELPVAGGMLVKFKTMVVEYAEFDGRLYPVKTVQESPMGIQEITITKVIHDKVGAEDVQPPEAVKPLLP